MDFHGDIFEDDPCRDVANHLLETCPRLHLARVVDVGQLQHVLAGDHLARVEISFEFAEEHPHILSKVVYKNQCDVN